LWDAQFTLSYNMPSNADNVILTFPPRPISQWERTLLAEWFIATQQEGLDIARAYVSERRGDDPMIVGRIAIVVRPKKEASHLIYSPAESTFWVLSSAPSWGDLQRFRTLRAALNAVRPVLDSPNAAQGAEIASNLVW
jgi:RimJ/RimL family protein N-acetyltransferase